MIVSHQHKFIFLKTRKTAGSSIEVLLSGFCGPDDIVTPLGASEEAARPGHEARNYLLPFWRWQPKAFGKLFAGHKLREQWAGYHQHMEAKAVRRAVGERVWPSYFKFSAERNPWDREVSMYHWRTRKMSTPPSFEDYVRRGDRRLINNFEIYSLQGKIVAEDVILFEELHFGLKRVLDRLGLPLSDDVIPRLKVGRRPAGDYRHYYSADTRAIIGDRFRREIEAFDFKF